MNRDRATLEATIKREPRSTLGISSRVFSSFSRSIMVPMYRPMWSWAKAMAGAGTRGTLPCHRAKREVIRMGPSSCPVGIWVFWARNRPRNTRGNTSSQPGWNRLRKSPRVVTHRLAPAARVIWPPNRLMARKGTLTSTTNSRRHWETTTTFSSASS